MTATVIIETDRLIRRYGRARGIDEVSIAVERSQQLLLRRDVRRRSGTRASAP
jgi:hypothetical protein